MVLGPAISPTWSTNERDKMKVAYFDCFSGISGNMILGALVDAGLDVERLKQELARLKVSGYSLEARTVQRRGLRGIHVQVMVTEEQPQRHLHDIEEIIAGSDMPDPVKGLSLAVFLRLAEAEAHVHGMAVEQVHFHEVGAVDAIVDVVGAALGIWLLEVQQVYASPLHVGRGTVKSEHGVLPVPAPATLQLLQGVPIYGRDVDAELVTPTGAAIITAIAEGFGEAPAMQVAQIGYGAGTHDLALPNLLRVAIGETTEQITGYDEDVVTLIETNLDDMNPQWYDYVMERLFEAGALDVFLTPIQMKQNRPGVQLSILVPTQRVKEVLEPLFDETTTLGVRTERVLRWKLSRESISVRTPYGVVAAKVARKRGRVMNIKPEHRDCRRLAAEHHVPLKEVVQAALEAARRQLEYEEE
jgi:uncharacterized protein (TIGR00299 family) protein